MEAFAKKYVDMGFVPSGVSLKWDHDKCKKKIGFKSMWEKTTLGTYKEFFSNDDNGIVLLTGEPSDIIVVDCDILKPSEFGSGILDGIAVWDKLMKQHGLPANTPVQVTPSGGKHYFFSLSKSMEGGLNSVRNATKVRVNGVPSSIDIRADRGCIIVAPSQVNKKPYDFVVPLVKQAELPAMPDWCIDILNSNSTNSKGKDVVKMCKRMDKLTLAANLGHRVAVFIADVKSLIESTLGTKIANQWERANGFDFKPHSIVECVLCGNIHDNHCYIVRQILGPCFYVCSYSNRCPPRAFNWESHESLKSVLQDPATDQPYALMLNASFRSQGFLLVHAYDMKTEKGRFMCFNGQVWCELSKHRVLSDIADTCQTILSKLLMHVYPERGATKDKIKEVATKRSQFAKGHAYVKKSTNVKNILAYYCALYTDEVLESRLDQNADILVVKNGVIELENGELRGGLPSDYMSRQLDVEYKGLDAKTDIIDAFISDLFNHDQESILYLQRLLGYGITGRTDSQVWAMFTGEGSNGKSLLASLLESLLEDWFVTAPYEIFFRGDQRAREGSHSTHLGTIRHARICLKEEAEPKDKLNVEILKTITGGSSITMRSAYASSYQTFHPMCLPILLCNHRPEVDITDHAMMRRIVVVPFHNVYTVPDDPKRPFNSNNPRHRLRDSDLKAKLLKEDAREQLLVWLVKGAVAWYKEKDFSKQPPIMLQAFQAYNDENDKLRQFIDMSCEVGELYYANAGKLRESFCKTMGTQMLQAKFIALMAEKGFNPSRTRINGTLERIYKGLRLSGTENAL